MKKIFVLISFTALFAFISCINNTEQARLDLLKQDSIKKANDILKLKQDSIKNATDTANENFGKSVEEELFGNTLSIGPISIKNNSEGYHYARLFLNAFNRALKWGKLNKTIKTQITKNLFDLNEIGYESTLYDPNGTTSKVLISINYSFQGYIDGTWAIKFSPDKIIMDGSYINSRPSDIEFLNEKTINELIPKLKEIIIIGEKQNEKEKLFH